MTEKKRAQGVNLLKDKQVKTLPPGKHCDGGGLYLIVDQTGARRWQAHFTAGGRRREMGLGGVQGLSLADAREKMREIKSQIASGIDPIADKEAKKAAATQAKIEGQTFGSFADHWLETYHAPSLTNDKSADQWRMTLKVYAASIREKPISAIETDDILKVLKPIWQEKPETARRLRGRLEKILDAATTAGARGNTANPARLKGHLEFILPKTKKLTRGHHAAMDYNDIPAFMIELGKREASSARALAFIILTACRAGEALGARWKEVDLDKGLWKVPAHRMKAKKEHTIPLSKAALAILRVLEPLAGGDQEAFLFRGQTNRPLTLTSIDKVRARMGVADVTTHGFRSSFRDWAGNETNAAREVAEACLAHAVGNAVEQSYRRGDAIEKRRDLLEQWSNHCMGVGGARVIRLASKRVSG